MDKLFKLVEELFKIRGIPQLLFYDSVYPPSMIKVRDCVVEFGKNHKFDKLDFILNSGGGSPGDAYRIIKMLRNHFEEVNIIVPFWAKSAATLLSLGGSNIIMNELGEFGPIDVQLPKEKDDSPEYDWESALNDEATLNRIEERAKRLYLSLYEATYGSDKIRINKTEISKQILDFVSDFYKPLLEQINPYKIGDKKRKLDIGTQYANKILIQYGPQMTREKRRDFIDYLVNECPEHGYIIDFEILRHFMTNVKKSIEISESYDGVLTEVSNFFIQDMQGEFIGFIPNLDMIINDNNKMILHTKPDKDADGLVIEDNEEIIHKESIQNENLN